MSAAAAIAIGIKVASIAVQAFGMVEGSETSRKGNGKLALARDFMAQMTGGQCAGDAELRAMITNGSPDVQVALNELAAAYAKFQKAVAASAK